MLSPGEISTGMKVTVVEWKPREIPNLSLFSDPALTPPTVTISGDRSFCGDVCEVMAVDLPYIIIRRLGETLDCFKKPTKIDTRECTLKELSPEYVTAMLSS